MSTGTIAEPCIRPFGLNYATPVSEEPLPDTIFDSELQIEVGPDGLPVIEDNTITTNYKTTHDSQTWNDTKDDHVVPSRYV